MDYQKSKEIFEEKLKEYAEVRGAIIPMLQAAQDCFGYVPEEAIRRISEITRVPEADIFGIVTFYAQFRLQPMGKFVIRVCEGTSCHVNGAKMIMQTIQDELSVETGETDKTGLFTLLSVACIGCCSLAPVIMVNDETHGRLTPASVRKIVKNYRRKGMESGVDTSGPGKERREEN